MNLTVTAIATRYWAGHFGCAEKELFSQPLRIVSHRKDLVGYHGIFALFRGSTSIVSVPPEWEAVIRRQLSAQKGLVSPLVMAAMLADVAGLIIGPAAIGYASAVSPPTHPVRELGPNDSEAREALQQACTPQEWEHGGGSEEDPASGFLSMASLPPSPATKSGAAPSPISPSSAIRLTVTAAMARAQSPTSHAGLWPVVCFHSIARSNPMPIQ